MERLVHLNGELLDRADAMVPVLDRGFLFADAVYEGMGVLDGRIVDFEHHRSRLERSLREVSIELDRSRDDWWHLLIDLATANDVAEGFLYLQITRGVAATRDYVYDEGLTPTVFAYVERNDGPGADNPPAALTLATAPDLRWARRDVKTTNLLGQVIAKQHAEKQGCDEALLVTATGEITECASSSFFFVQDGAIVTRPLSNNILPGVTRRSVIAAATDLGLRVEERVAMLSEATEADEAFITGASTYVEPVVAIDGHPVGTGEPGPVTLRVREEYLRQVRSSFYEPY